MLKQVYVQLMLAGAIFLSYTANAQDTCTTLKRSDIPAALDSLYDSLRAASPNKYTISNYHSDSISVTDTARITRLPIDLLSNSLYFPHYLQFSGSFRNFVYYILWCDPALDSVARCGSRVTLYYSDRCELCDSGFWYGTAFLPTQFNYYRFQEIYAAFFQYELCQEICVYAGTENCTYIPYGSDLAVNAPAGVMKKKWFIRNLDYAVFLPVDFPADMNSDVTMNEDGNFYWSSQAADRQTSTYRKKKRPQK